MVMEFDISNQVVCIYRDKPLGKGSYGSVYKAQCDELPCAAKILHSIFFKFNDPASQVLVKKFEQECEVMRTMKHPHIVQYLGTYRDPETGLPVLLMELMDESLTKFLERSQDVPFHVKVNLCHDIALALAYLHSSGIIHRDLSSNNVLLIAGSRAKVTDFGMSKLIESNPCMTPLTQCPGTEVYMSPEALRTPPIYTTKLDTFSFGVLSLQTMTHIFPNPGPARNTIEDLRYPTGKIEVPVPEVERRKEHIAMVNPSCSLLAIALQCLNDEEKARPTARTLCQQLAAIKDSSEYKLSVDLSEVHSHESGGTTPSELTKMVRELQLQQEADKCELEKRNAKIKHLTENQKSIEGVEEKMCALTQKLKEKEDEIEMLQQKLSSQEGYQHSQSGHLEATFELSWKRLRNAPCEMSRGATTVHEDTVYFSPFDSQKVFAYTLDEGRWSSNAMPECPHQNFHLLVVNGLLTAVGGQYEGEITNSLLSLVDGDQDSKWVQKFPPFPTKRMSVSVVHVHYIQYLIVAGGKLQLLANEDKVATVEVMNVNTLQWHKAANLPYPACSMGASVCGDHLYLGGGFDADGETKKVLHCSLPALIQSCQSLSLGARIKRAISYPQGHDHHIWQNIADVTVDHPKFVALRGELVAVGCRGLGLSTTTAVCMYNPRIGYWKTVGTVPTARDWSLVVAPADNKFQLMVVGGYVQSISGSSCTDIVEVASVL